MSPTDQASADQASSGQTSSARAAVRQPLPARRIMFVHAHPDDETIMTGATMARYSAEQAQVTLVTCTLGEEGEVHVPALAGLSATQADQLGGYRLAELERACMALGVADVRLLGGVGRYRDSGMMGLPSNDHPRCFWRADLDLAAHELLELIAELRPQVMVTYDANGGYGHPDHIQAHRVTMRAVELAAAAGVAPAKLYWHAIPRSVLEAGFELFAASTDNPFAGVERVEDLPFGTPDDQVTTRIEARAHAEAKSAAVRAHATQVPPTSWLFTIAANFREQFMGVEHYTLALGARRSGRGAHGWEDDLFADVPVDAGSGAIATLPG